MPTSTVKDRPIIFTPDNITKVESGVKTQTRRIIKPEWWRCLDPEDEDDRAKAIKQCPFGTVGDRLYVKEGLETNGGLGIRYRRDQQTVKFDHTGQYPLWQWKNDYLSPLHMPKWAARLWLEIVDVRVERLWDITEADAIAEGCTSDIGNNDPKAKYLSTAVGEYRNLWDAIHGYEAWLKNDWVWVLSYRKVKI